MLSANPSIKGLPDSPEKFVSAMSNEESLKSLHSMLSSNSSVKGLPSDVNVFVSTFSQPKGEEPVGGATSGQDSNAPTQPSSNEPAKSNYFNVDLELAKAENKLEDLAAQGQKDGWSSEQLTQFSQPVVEQISGLKKLKYQSPEEKVDVRKIADEDLGRSTPSTFAPTAPKVAKASEPVRTPEKTAKQLINSGNKRDVYDDLRSTHAMAVGYESIPRQSDGYDIVGDLKEVEKVMANPNATPEQKEWAKQKGDNYENGVKAVINDYLSIMELNTPLQAKKTREKYDEIAAKGSNLDLNDQKWLAEFKAEAIDSRFQYERNKLATIKSSYDWEKFDNESAPLVVSLNDLSAKAQSLYQKSGGKPSEELTAVQTKIEELSAQLEKVKQDTGINDDVLDQYGTLVDTVGGLSRVAQVVDQSATNEYKQALYEKKKLAETYYNFMKENPTLGAITAFTQGAVKGVVSGIASVAQAPAVIADALGAEGYGATDKMFDAVENINGFMESIMPAAEKTEKVYNPITESYDEVTKTVKNLPGIVGLADAVGNGVGSLLAYAAPSTEIGAYGKAAGWTNQAIKKAQTASTFLSTFLMQEGSSYKEYLAAGADADTAARWASAESAAVASASLIMPDFELVKPTISRSFLAALKSGATAREAFNQSMKWIGRESKQAFVKSLGEGSEEVVENAAQHGIRKMAGDQYVGDVGKLETYADAFIGGLETTLFVGLVGATTKRTPTQEQLMGYIGANYSDILNKVKGVDPEKYAQLEKTLSGLKDTYDSISKLPGYDKMSQGEKDRVLAQVQRKKMIIKNAKEASVEEELYAGELEAIDKEVSGIFKTAEARESAPVQEQTTQINDTQNEPGVRGTQREGQAPIETQPNQGAGTETPQAGGVVQAPQEELNSVRQRIVAIEAARRQGKILQDETHNELNNLKAKEKELVSTIEISAKEATVQSQEVEAKIQEEFKANGLDRVFPLAIDESTPEGQQLAQEKLAQEQAQADIRAKYTPESPINQSQEAKTESNVAQVGQKPAILEEGSTTSLPPQIQGATPRTMVFKDGMWQQQVGGTTTRVSENVQAQAQQAFDQQNQQIAQEEAAQEEMAHATIEEEKAAAVEREARIEQVKAANSTLTPSQVEDAADLMAARGVTASEAARRVKNRISPEEAAEIETVANKMAESFKSAGITVEFGSTDEYESKDGTTITEGIFIGKDDGKIIIDKTKLSKEFAKTVVFHEGTHPIVNIIRNTNPKLYSQIVEASKKLKGMGISGVDSVTRFAESSVDPNESEEQQRFTVEDEFIAELIGRVASGKINLNSIPSESRSVFAKIINGIAKLLGMKPVMLDTDIVALKKLASDISRVLSTGADISEIVGKENVGQYKVNLSTDSGSIETGETVYAGQARVSSSTEEVENPYRESVNLPVKSLKDLLKEYGDNVIVVNSDPTGLGTVTLPSGKKIHLDGGIGYMAIEENIKAEVGFASSSDARVRFLNKKAAELRDAGKLKDGKVLVLVMVQKADSMLGNNYTPDYVADALAKIPKNVISKKELSELLQEPFDKAALVSMFTNQKPITKKTKKKDIPAIEEQNKKNMANGMAKIKKIKGEIASLDPRSAHDRLIEIFHELNFVQAQAYFASVLGNYTNKTTKYNKKLASLLYQYAGADQKSLFRLLGEKSLVERMIANPKDWGYAVAAFVHDTAKQDVQLGGIKHNLFNSKFQGGKRYILDKAYLVNDIMVEFNKEQDRKVSEGEKEGAVYAEQQTSQGMYAYGKATAPKAKGAEFESLKETKDRYQASRGTREEFSSNADETIARLKNAKEEDGATLNLDGTTYEGGGLVVPAGSVNVPQGKISADGLYKFLEDNEDKISSDIFKIGLYKFPDRSEVSYDLNIVIPREHREVALEFGKLSGQESLFDLDTYENIKTGSDGKNPRQFSGEELASIAKDLSEGKMPSVVQASRGTRESIEDSYYSPHMTEDGGDYIFFHVSGADKKAINKGIDSTKFNSLRTSREEKGLQYGVASFYTKPEDGERMVGGEKYVVRVSKDKVYPMDLDPNGYKAKAEKKFPADTPFRKANIDKAMADMAKKDGFEMAVGEWNYSRTGKKTELPEFRADALVALKPTGEKASEFESNMDKGMERVAHPEQAALQAKEKVTTLAEDIADHLSSKRKFNEAYQIANHYRTYGEVVVNRFEDNEFTRDMTKEDFDVMTKKLPKSFDTKIAGIRENLPSAEVNQKSQGVRESSEQALIEEIDNVLDQKGVDATMSRRQFKEKYGSSAYERAVKVTRNFNQIIENLEKEGIVKKQCP